MILKGVVKKNIGRGTKLGFPTANIDVADDVLDGIYVGRVSLKEKLAMPALIFVGAAITFGDTKRFAEAYILDFHEDIYGQEIEMELIEKIRDSRKFETHEEMKRQIGEDEKIAKAYFRIS